MLPHIVERNTISTAFEQTVRDLRKKNGLSQEYLADRSGLHRNKVPGEAVRVYRTTQSL